MEKSINQFGVVVVVYGKGADCVLKNYPAIYEQLASKGTPVVIVDHGGHAYGAIDFVRPNIHYLKQANKGFGSGVNLGCRELFKSVDYVFVLNPDLDYAVNELEKVALDLAAPFYVLQVKEFGNLCDIFYYNKFSGIIKRTPSLGAVPYFNGAAFCISKDCFHISGGFDERYFLYFEDVDFSMRLRQLNIPLAIMRVNTFNHEVGGTRPGDADAFIQRAAACSALRMVRKWFWFNPWLYIRYSLKWLLAGIRTPNSGPSRSAETKMLK